MYMYSTIATEGQVHYCLCVVNIQGQMASCSLVFVIKGSTLSSSVYMYMYTVLNKCMCMYI